MLNGKKMLIKILKQIFNIQVGNHSGQQVPANSYLDIPITFDEPFDGIPVVIAGFNATSTASAIGSMSVASINVTESGFTFRVFNNATTARSPALRWIAINKIGGV